MICMALENQFMIERRYEVESFNREVADDANHLRVRAAAIKMMNP